MERATATILLHNLVCAAIYCSSLRASDMQEVIRWRTDCCAGITAGTGGPDLVITRSIQLVIQKKWIAQNIVGVVYIGA